MTEKFELIEIGATAVFNSHHEHYYPNDHHTAEAVIAAVRPHIEREERKAMLEELDSDVYHLIETYPSTEIGQRVRDHIRNELTALDGNQ